MKKLALAAGVAIMALAASPSFADILTTGTGDGQVVLDPNGFGIMASNQANYNPVGSIGSASTIFFSTLYYRAGTSGARANIGNGTLVSYTGNDTSRTSIFTLPEFSVALTQSVSNLLDSGGMQTGSQLTQSYSFTNTTAAALTLDLARYIDGDLLFDGSRSDGGGRLTANGQPLLFEIDSATGASTATTFLGLYNTGGTPTGYRLQEYSSLASFLSGGGTLDNTISNDNNPVDNFIDAGAGYDVALGLGAAFNVGIGSTVTFNTVTLFGSGAPGQVVIPPTGTVPEPASWAMMISGFGMIGAAMRRRRTVIRFA